MPTVYTHPFNDQKGKTNLDFTEARDTSLQADNHASTPPLSFLQARCPSSAQPTASKHCRQYTIPTV